LAKAKPAYDSEAVARSARPRQGCEEILLLIVLVLDAYWNLDQRDKGFELASIASDNAFIEIGDAPRGHGHDQDIFQFLRLADAGPLGARVIVNVEDGTVQRSASEVAFAVQAVCPFPRITEWGAFARFW
jgi:hypothetical protein